ncbi:unnamed protein product [Tetraodon nigroviridis]|uniref:(spotted green pufferfish) hypothetical protein n=1 Tax=Tetraodon nigroviridis TaxID=99883 RepID=Q4SZG8_TETNG|nr:unnamed protein product [Tetraodon nigroviridis]
MPTSPVKTRIPLTSFGHLITEVKKQLFGIEAPPPAQLTGWRKHLNSYTPQGRRNVCNALNVDVCSRVRLDTPTAEEKLISSLEEIPRE